MIYIREYCKQERETHNVPRSQYSWTIVVLVVLESDYVDGLDELPVYYHLLRVKALDLVVTSINVGNFTA